MSLPAQTAAHSPSMAWGRWADQNNSCIRHDAALTSFLHGPPRTDPRRNRNLPPWAVHHKGAKGNEIMTDTSPRRWHANNNPNLRDSLDTIDAHQLRVATLCRSLADFIGHPLTGSDLLHAALHHDEPERVLGDMPSPAKARFPMLAEQYRIAEAIVLTDMGLEWTLTAKEQQMLNLCDKLDAYTWATRHGARGPEWDGARTALIEMAKELSAFEWVVTEMGRTA